MRSSASRRNFLAAGLPSVALATPQTPAAAPQVAFRTLGKTGLKITSVGFGCMVTSDASVVSRAADMGITYFDTARVYGGGNNERMVGARSRGPAAKYSFPANPPRGLQPMHVHISISA